jgi:hypothetical protein
MSKAMKTTARTTSVCALAIAIITGTACGSSTPTTPSNPAPISSADACGILAGLGSGLRIDILSGAACNPPDRSPVVKLNMKGAGGAPVGSCTGTIVTPRAVLTAAHCLDEDVLGVNVWLGSGPEFVAASFVHFPGYKFNQPGLPDVGVIFMGEDLPRTPVSILTSRDGLVGETAIIAGYGRDENNVTVSLRAGSTTLSAVNSSTLQAQYAPPSSSVCSGDSGGPIMLEQSGRWAIAGITSATSSDACNTGTNFFQAVRQQSVRDFLQQHVPSIGQR